MANGLTAQHWIETYKSPIQISIEGFKFAALANGGAAIALLARNRAYPRVIQRVFS